MNHQTLSTLSIAANPALYRAYRALEIALHSSSDSDLARALNIYIDTAQKQGFLVTSATILRDSLHAQIIAEERRLSKAALDKSNNFATGQPPARLHRDDQPEQ